VPRQNFSRPIGGSLTQRGVVFARRFPHGGSCASPKFHPDRKAEVAHNEHCLLHSGFRTTEVSWGFIAAYQSAATNPLGTSRHLRFHLPKCSGQGGGLLSREVVAMVRTAEPRHRNHPDIWVRSSNGRTAASPGRDASGRCDRRRFLRWLP
jgi:hypothetical protein